MKGRILQKASSLLLAIIMVLTMIPAVSAQADEAQVGKIIIEGDNPVPGETVTVQVRLENNPGIASMRIELIYDNAVFKLTGLSYNSEMGGETNPPADLSGYQSPFVLYWNNGGLSTDYTEDGVFATLTFQVSEEAQKGRSYTITAVYDPDEIFNGQDENVTFEVTEGKLVVFDCVAGDVDGNGKVNMRDLTVLQRYYSGWTDQVVNTPVMDVNGDGKCNSRDVTTLQRHFAGWEVTLHCVCTMADCVHNLTSVPAKAATCQEEGNIAYWSCAACGKYFSDAAAKTEITYAQTKLALADHTVEKVEKTEPTCTATGTKEHWKCTVCGTLFSDADAKTEITDTTISAAGHTLSKIAGVEPTYTEPGVKEHWKCAICGALFADENGETKITENDTVIAPKTSYQIQYELYDENSKYLETIGVENQNPAYYDPEKGLVLTNLQAEGYTFAGWYDDDGKRVREIATGTTGVVGLNAKWTPITYYLTMRDLMDDSKTIDFTAESAFELEIPVWRHLTFSHWEDQSGKLTAFTDATGATRLRLEQGTIAPENIEVVAKWKNPINQVVNNNSENNLIGCQYEEEAQMYWFVYEIGKIEKVILGNKEDYAAQYHSGGNHELTHTKQISITEETGTNIAELSAATVSKSTEWGTVREDVLTVSENIGMSVKTGIEAEEGVEGIAKVKESIEMETSIDLGIEASTGIQESKNTGETITEESSQEVCNTFVYAKTIDYSETTATQMTPEDPVGYYRNVNAATVKVYAVVIYDPSTMTCYLETYSVISDTYLYPLYEREGYVDYANDSISYKVDVNQIEAYIKSAYYIQYDAYDGDEKMPITVAAKDAVIAVRTDFTRTGYTLTGWKYLDEKGTEQQIILAQGQNSTVKNLAEVGKTVTLKAIWTKNNYTIQYSADKPPHASNDVTNMPSDQPCMYDTGVTLASAPILVGWNFDGWYHNGEKLGVGTVTENLTAEPGGTVTLTGNWTANDYTITYHKNDGSGAITVVTYKFDSTTSTLKADSFTRTDYTHIGWSKDKNATVPTYEKGETVGELAHSAGAINGNINLYAVWTPTTGSWNNGLSDSNNIAVRNDGYECFFQTNLNREELKAAGYTMVSIAGTIRGQRIYSWGAYDWYIEIYDLTDAKIHSDEIGKFDTSWETRNIQYTIPIDCIRDDGTIKVRFDHCGGSNERGQYRLGLIQITATAK